MDETTNPTAPETVEAPEPPTRGALIASYTGSVVVRQRADGLPHEGHDPTVTELEALLERTIGGEWDVVATVSLTRTDR